MVNVKKLDKSNKQFLLDNFIKCSGFKTCIEDGLCNPDNKQVEWFRKEYHIHGDSIEIPASFPIREVRSSELSIYDLKIALVKAAAGDKSLIVKFCCWLHFQLDELLYHDFVIVGKITKQAELLLNTLEDFGNTFIIITPEIYKELKLLAKEQEIIGYIPCRNAWMSTPNPLEEILNRPQGVNTVFCEIKGTNSLATYSEDLFSFYQKVKGNCIVIDGKIPPPTNDEVKKLIEHDDVISLSKNLGGFKGAVLSRFLRENSVSENSAKVLTLWLKRYFNNLSKECVKTFIYYGACIKKNDVLFLELLSELPVDVIIFNHSKEDSCDFGGDFLILDGEYSSPLAKFPKDGLYTQAASVEQTLDKVLYNTENFSRANQYNQVRSVILNVTKEDVLGLWNEEIKLRTGYTINDGVVITPTIYAQVVGTGSSSKKSYFDFIATLEKNSKCFVTETLEISSIDLDGDIVVKAWNGRHFNQVYAKKLMEGTMLDILSEEKKDLLVSKAGEMIKEMTFPVIWDAFLFLDYLFSIPETLIRLIQTYDLTKVNPKIVMVLTGARKLDKKEELMLNYMHRIGFDVLLFVPTGYSIVSENFLRSGLQKIDLGNYRFDLTSKDLSFSKLNSVEKFLYKIGSLFD